jgi:hypothetical protein
VSALLQPTVPEENPKMLQIIERYEDVDGVLVRCESGFTDDSACPDAEAPATLTRMDHVVGFVALVGRSSGLFSLCGRSSRLLQQQSFGRRVSSNER